jgi:glucose/arabinose dehydrogenase
VTPTVVDGVNFTESAYVSNPNQLGFATGMAWAPDGSNRLFVIRKSGQVRVVQNGALLPTPFATVQPVYADSFSESGLIGICFDRNYVNNRYVYLFVSVAFDEQQVIRYTDNGNVGTNKTTLIAGLPGGGQHVGGAIGVGLDNKLYFAIGDLGGGVGVDNDLTTLASKVGRANLDGTPVVDNPFNDNDGVNEPADYVFARGFRNPFTMAFQESTGQLWVNVVGTLYEQVFKVNAGNHAGWNNFENNQPAGYVTPAVVYGTNYWVEGTITAGGAVRSGGVATFTTTAAHGFRRGGKVTIANVGDGSFNGSDFNILDVPTPTTFTVAQAGPNATSGGGRASGSGLIAGEVMGGCITGGAFYTSTAFPPAYRGNFFFGDYNTGRVFRVSLDAGNNVTSVNLFSTGITNCVDVTVGPDGAVYYIGAGGDGVIRRTAHNATAQGLVITPTALNVSEGGSLGFSVRLATAPAGDVTVTVARTAGDGDITVAAGATLTFTPQNYAAPQAVTLGAAEDADGANDAATISVSASGLATQTVAVTAIDNDAQELVVSTTALTVNEGGTGQFTVALRNPPSGNVTVTVQRVSGDANVTVQSGASLTFTPQNYATPQPVTVAAAEDADAANDTATLAVDTPGAARRLVEVTALDNDSSPPAITSPAVTTAVINAPYTYDVNATGNPAPTYSLTVFPAGMTINPTTGVISWTPPATGTFNVTVRAANGVLPDATQPFTVTVGPDLPPAAVLTQPGNGATVSGANAEFFGDGVDAVGCVRAEFFIDGVLRYTDVNTQGHYHFGGAHLQWDTTQLSNGSHTLRFVVYDTIGQSGAAQVTVTVNNPNPPLGVAGVQVDDGTAQRSVVRSLAVTFTGVVNIAAGAFELARLGAGGGPVNLNVSTQVVGGSTVATLTFLNSLDPVHPASLADGNYRLTVRGALITDGTGRPIDADGDGHTGGDRVDVFHRLYSDLNGDRTVNGADYNPFRVAFGAGPGNPNYRADLDANGDGFINGADFNEFRTRFGLTLPPPP